MSPVGWNTIAGLVRECVACLHFKPHLQIVIQKRGKSERKSRRRGKLKEGMEIGSEERPKDKSKRVHVFRHELLVHISSLEF